MQTIERPTEIGPEDPRPPQDGLIGALVAAVIALPLMVLAVQWKWGVIIAVGVGIVFCAGLWVWRRGFTFIQIAAFSLQVDGLNKGGISGGRIVAGVAFIYIAHKLFVEKWRPPALPMRHWLPPLALLTWCTISGAWSEKISGWLTNMALLGLALAYFLVAALLVDSHAKVFQFLRAYWVGGLIGSAMGVLGLGLGMRSVGFAGDPNFFGILQASMIPLTVYYRRKATKPIEKWVYTLTLCLVLVGAAGAGSRSGLIGASLAIVATMITKPGLSPSKRVKKVFQAILVAGLAFLLGFVANPANLVRGFSDRGAGRLDFWQVTVDIIGERPVIGQGFGQVMGQIIPRLATTPGVPEFVRDDRTEVSSHNTWLDLMGDLGVFGTITFAALFVFAILGFLRPKWAQMKEISTTMLVMLIPVMSGSQFLPLLNNKLGWCMFGLAASTQVPSAEARWRGYVRRRQLRALPRAGASGSGPRRAAPDMATLEEPAPTIRIVTGVPGPGVIADPELARWDLRVSQRFRMALGIGAAVGFVGFLSVMATVPMRYTASAGIVAPNFDQPNTRGIFANQERLQVFHTLAATELYAAKLKELSGIDLSVPEIKDRVSVVRPEGGAFMDFRFTDTNEDTVLRVKPYLVTAMDNIVADARAAALPEMLDERRPAIPGEQRFFTDDLYAPVYREGTSTNEVPRRAWGALVGALSGTLVALGFMFAQQRYPRVNNDDRLDEALGLGVWTHVGRSGRRFAATPDQYAQVVTSCHEMFHGEVDVNRIVIASAKPDRAARSLAMGVAASIAASGRRVILVDGQVERPLDTARLALLGRRCGLGRPGLIDVVDGTADHESVVRRV
ncbi:MAG: O-antigen ligase family protein, partial [Acidimicrobiales bacterium]